MNRSYLTTGFAIFTMFYGAGNIVLPLFLVQEWKENWFLALVGFCLTGVVVTLLGLISSVLARNIDNFFSPLGLYLGFALQLVLILIEGPFGIIPRCFMVANGGFTMAFSGFPKEIFYLIICALILYIAINKNKLVSIIGNFVTPIMISFLIALILVTYFTNPHSIASINLSSQAFYDGIVKGYLTYDLPAAIYFTSIAMVYLKGLGEKPKEIFENGLKSTFVSSLLLTLFYFGFFYLGLKNLDLIKDVKPEFILPTIITSIAGHSGIIIFAAFIFIACLTTAIAAITVWTDFIEHNCQKFLKIKLSRNYVIFFSLIISYVMAMRDFSDLMNFLTPILMIVYPLLICLVIFHIYVNVVAEKKYKA